MIIRELSNDELIEKTADNICNNICRYTGSGIPDEAMPGLCCECDLDIYMIEINNRINSQNEEEKPKAAGLMRRLINIFKI